MNNERHSGGRHFERVTLTLASELRAELDRESVRRTIERGRPVSRSVVARDLLERALAAQNGEAA
jgi:hypothetical protein